MTSHSMNILPNEILVIILRKVPFHERLQCRFVSPRWTQVVNGMCHQMTTLKLFGSYRVGNNYVTRLRNTASADLKYWQLKDDDLVIDATKFHWKMCQLLARLFPNVRHLIVEFRRNLFWEHLPFLLDDLVNLTSLTLLGNFKYPTNVITVYSAEYEQHRIDKDLVLSSDSELSDDDEDDDEDEPELKRRRIDEVDIKHSDILVRILRSINRMTSLTRLDILVKQFLLIANRFELSQQLDRVLPQLTRFALSDRTDVTREEHYHLANPPNRPSFADVIRLLGPRCTHLRLDCLDLHNAQLIDSIESHPHLSTNLKDLYLSVYDHDEEEECSYAHILKHFPSVQCLTLHYYNQCFFNNAMFNYMNKLTNLTELRVLSRAFVYYDLDGSNHLKMPTRGDAPLGSVKRIYWFDFSDGAFEENSFDGERFCQTLSAWFPKLEELFIEFAYRDDDTKQIADLIVKNIEFLRCLIRHEFTFTRVRGQDIAVD